MAGEQELAADALAALLDGFNTGAAGAAIVERQRLAKRGGAPAGAAAEALEAAGVAVAGGRAHIAGQAGEPGDVALERLGAAFRRERTERAGARERPAGRAILGVALVGGDRGGGVLELSGGSAGRRRRDRGRPRARRRTRGW